MRGSERLWQNAADKGIVGVDGIERLDGAVRCVKTVVYLAQVD
jgi:hypothetical protein